ncbi:MAG TPA: serine hydrolase domain-containing protein [Bradyrhizobium sp.]|nr:serine hydrolase domain-containing protein [Bradyrhizobium sp.]
MNLRFALRSLVGAALLAGATAIAPASAQGTFDLPPGAHFNPQKLERIGEFFRGEIEGGKIPGAIVLIQQHGKPVYFEKFGVRDVATGLPMTDDTIFTVYSMSKPVTSVAAMMLVDDGKLKLSDPIEKYIPSFATAKVGVEGRAENGDRTLQFVPLQRSITILDLMRHTSGITYGFYGDSLVRALYSNTLLYAGDFDNAEFADRIARLPLAEQPGTLWDYGHSTDVLGRVIEVASGKSLLQFEKERLLDPLGMTATGFYITDPAQLPLLAATMPNDNNFSAGSIRNARRMLKWESGGGGMISTVTDFAKFSQMLLNGGSLDGRQYLSPQAFNEMAADHVGPGSGIARDYFYFPGDGFGYGLGFGVRTDPGIAKPPPPGSLGELKWDGASGCYFIIDRKQDMFFILMEQTPSQRQRIQAALKKLIYEAMEN